MNRILRRNHPNASRGATGILPVLGQGTGSPLDLRTGETPVAPNATPVAPNGTRAATGRQRRGIALITAMVCLAMVVVLMSLIVQVAMMRHSVARDESRQLQAAWLADSALQRAAARLAADREYAGETWKIGAEAFGGRHAGVVLIEVTAPDEDSRSRIVRVRADFPDDPVHRARRSRQITILLPDGE